MLIIDIATGFSTASCTWCVFFVIVFVIATVQLYMVRVFCYCFCYCYSTCVVFYVVRYFVFLYSPSKYPIDGFVDNVLRLQQWVIRQ